MSLVLNEEQHQLKNSAREFLSAQSPIEAYRVIRDANNDELSYDPLIWQKMTELGWPAITINEAYDGLGFGYQGLGLVFEEIGQRLSASPLFSSIVLCASLIELLGSEEQKKNYLTKLAAGEITMALAFEEAQRHQDLEAIKTQITDQEKPVLTGTKRCVLNAIQADFLLVIAKDTSDKLVVAIVESKAAGCEYQSFRLLDGSLAHHLHFNNCPALEVIASSSDTDTNRALNQMLSRARAILAAEMLGACLSVFQQTMEYIKQREQFDVKIGSFQALKHRASQMFIQLELCKSSVLAALNAIDLQTDDVEELACLAKTILNDTFILVTDEATQMHGGMGVTDELDVGIFLKRARVYTQLFGDSAFLRNHYACLKNY